MRTAAGTPDLPDRGLRHSTPTSLSELIDPAVLEIRDRYLRTTTAAAIRDAFCRAATGLRGALPALNDPSMQASMGIFCTPEQVQQQWGLPAGSPRPIRPWCCRSRRYDPCLPRQSRPCRRSRVVPDRGWLKIRSGTAGQRSKWGRTIDKITQVGTELQRQHSPVHHLYPKHMGDAGAPVGLLPCPAALTRSAPTGWPRSALSPIPIAVVRQPEGHGGPTTFIPDITPPSGAADRRAANCCVF